MALPALRRNQELWDPFRGFEDLQREMNRMFSSFGRGFWPATTRAGEEELWAPPIDIHETKDQVIVKTELPGVKPEDIEVSVSDSRLTLKAERKHEKVSQDEQCYSCELAYGAFRREIDLPQAVGTENLKANYKNGILEITLPKQEGAKPKQIKVEVNK